MATLKPRWCPDRLSSVFWLVFGFSTVYFSKKIGTGTLSVPGPGFLPFWSGIGVSCLSVVILLQSVKTRHKGQPQTIGELWTGQDWRKALMVTAVLLGYFFIFTRLGFLVSTTGLLIFLFRIIQPMRWMFAAGGALLASVTSFVVFDLFLKVQLPRGLVEKLLF